MPITQERLIDLINIYDLFTDRRRQLTNQTRAITLQAIDARNEDKIEDLFSAFQALANEVNHLCRVREEEQNIFISEKKYFEMNAERNRRNRDSMSRARHRKANLIVADEEQADFYRRFKEEYGRDLGPDENPYAPQPTELTTQQIQRLSTRIYNTLTSGFENNFETITAAVIAQIAGEHEETTSRQIIPFMIDMGLLIRLSENSYKAFRETTFGTTVFDEPLQ